MQQRVEQEPLDTSERAPEAARPREQAPQLPNGQDWAQVDDPDPTAEIYAYWGAAFSLWNRRFFEGALPKVALTLVRKSGVMGYFKASAMENRAGRIVPEIALNPAYFAPYGDEEAHRTLIHEMCHLWRHLFGPKNAKGGRGSRGYHDTVWADKMESIGIGPSSTGKPGGKRTGYRVSDYTIPGGAFETAFRALAKDGFEVDWRDHEITVAAPAETGLNEAALSEIGLPAAPTAVPARGSKKLDRVKFTCPDCGQNAWAKPSAQLACGICSVPLIPADRSPQ